MSLEPPSDAAQPADEPAQQPADSAQPPADDTARQPVASTPPRPGAKPSRAKPAQKQTAKPAPRHAAPPRGNGKQSPPTQLGVSFPADLADIRLPRDHREPATEPADPQPSAEPPAGTDEGPGYWMPPPPEAATTAELPTEVATAAELPTEALPVVEDEPTPDDAGGEAPDDAGAVVQPSDVAGPPAPADRGESSFDVTEVKEQVGEPQTTSLLPPRPAARRPGWAPVAVFAAVVLLRRRRRRRRAARG
jgi:hypothetical protein